MGLGMGAVLTERRSTIRNPTGKPFNLIKSNKRYELKHQQKSINSFFDQSTSSEKTNYRHLAGLQPCMEVEKTIHGASMDTSPLRLKHQGQFPPICSLIPTPCEHFVNPSNQSIWSDIIYKEI